MFTPHQSTTTLGRSFALAALAGVLALGAGCGDDGGVQTNPPLAGKGSGSGGAVSGTRLGISMPVDPATLTPFAAKAKDICGAMLKCEFHVKSVKITYDVANTSAIMNFQDAFSGDVDIKLKPGTGTKAGVPVGKLKSPRGNGTLDADLVTDQKAFDTLKEEILASSLVIDLSGPTNWNTAETKKVGVIAAVVLEVVPKS